MAYIIQKSFSTYEPINDKALQLANEIYQRSLAIGTNWTRLRLGLMYAITPDGTANLSGVKFALGLVAFGGGTFGQQTVGHYLGAIFSTDGNVDGGALTYQAGGGNPYFSSTGIRLFLQVGSAVNYRANRGTIYHPATSGTVARRGVIFFEAQKGTPWIIRAWGMPSSAMSRDFGWGHFQTTIEQPGDTLNLDGHTLLGVGDTVTVDQAANGALDSVTLFWNKSQQPIEIYAIAVQRLA